LVVFRFLSLQFKEKTEKSEQEFKATCQKYEGFKFYNQKRRKKELESFTFFFEIPFPTGL